MLGDSIDIGGIPVTVLTNTLDNHWLARKIGPTINHIVAQAGKIAHPSIMLSNNNSDRVCPRILQNEQQI